MPFRSSSVQSKLMDSADVEPSTLSLSLPRPSFTCPRPWLNPSFLNLPSAFHRASSSSSHQTPAYIPLSPSKHPSSVPSSAWWRAPWASGAKELDGDHGLLTDAGVGTPVGAAQLVRERRRNVRVACQVLGGFLCIVAVVAGVGLLFTGLPHSQRHVGGKVETPL